MRYYTVGHTATGIPYIEAVASERYILEDHSKDLLTREQLEADPDLKPALADWDNGDDRAVARDKALWTIKEHGLQLLHDVEDFLEAAELVGDVDDFFCESVRRIAATLDQTKEVTAAVMEEAEEALGELHATPSLATA